MKIAIIGYGKMGRTIEQIALERGHEIVCTIDKNNKQTLTDGHLSSADVAIEFSEPGSAVSHLIACFEQSVPVVCGTTGWLEHWDEVINKMQSLDATLFYSSNFSVGIFIFSKLNALLAKYMNKFNEYEVELEEIHHIHKKDAPSGTALSLAKQIIDGLDRKRNIVTYELEANRAISKDVLISADTLPIFAKRIGETPGTHSVKYHSDVDDIDIRHTAHGRRGFAMGAVLAAEYIVNHQPKGLIGMDDLFDENSLQV